jgi:subtilase family serine protease
MRKYASVIPLCLLFGILLVSMDLRIQTKIVSADNYWIPTGKFSNYTMPVTLPLEFYASSDSPISGALTPAQIRNAYNLPSNGGQGTIAIIDAYDDPTIMTDANVFSQQFNLPNLTTSNFFVQKEPGIETNAAATIEISMDVEWAHAIAPNANILLLLGKNTSLEYLLDGIYYARGRSDVVAVSMSWGIPEQNWAPGLDYVFQPSFGNASMCFFASSGDKCENVSWPASSPNVVGVGGTTLNITNGQFSSETVWYEGIVNGTPIGTGGGMSQYEQEPAFQTSYGITDTNGMRSVPDVSFNAGTPVNLYDTSSNGPAWQAWGGTSLGAPCWASIYSIGLTASNNNLYNDAEIANVNQTRFRDITVGWNGLYNATAGYDKVTGLGSPLATTFSVPKFAMKTLTDGKFYNPNQTVPYVKVEEWFTDSHAEGDQVGKTTPGYNFTFPDGKVSLSDLVTLAKAYGSTEGSPKWNYQADINNDGKVNLSDLQILAKDYTSASIHDWYNTDVSYISINFTITGNPQPVTETLDGNGFASIPANCTGWLVFNNVNSTAVGAFLTFWG